MEAYLVQISGGRVRQSFPVSPDGTVVGRGQNCRVRVPDPRVSKHHAWIKHDGTEWYIEDRGSRNGTYVNGTPITRTPLKDRDEITFAACKCVFIVGALENIDFTPSKAAGSGGSFAGEQVDAGADTKIMLPAQELANA